MEPLLPADQDGSLADLGWQVVRRAERLGGALHPVTARGLAGVVQVMNSYYTHLIEGHQTTPADLQAVLARVPAGKPKAREIQQLHLAHLRAQEQMERDLESGSAEVTSTSFLLGLHRHFYEALPTCARNVQDGSGASHAVEPGCLRDFHVSVGQHLAPHHEALPQFLSHFAKRYAPEVKDTGPSLVACAAAHHRLVWIHPFADGNGRVARLFSQAWHQRSGVHAHGLWSISRGLARNLDGYRAALAAADEKRRNDTDGRGYLSAAALTAFCRFYLETCMDQLDFMAQRLEVDALLRRVHGATEMLEATGDLPKGSRYLLTEALLRGEMPRGDAARLIGKSPRTAQSVIRALLDSGHLTSPSEKGVLRLGFPRPALTAWLPGLFG
jgi:Fic family protein